MPPIVILWLGRIALLELHADVGIIYGIVTVVNVAVVCLKNRLREIFLIITCTSA
jgi:hypothetical protein